MPERQLIVHEQAKSPIAEAFRTLRTNLQFSRADGKLQAIMFTSAGPGEGKSTIVANNAVAIAQSGKRVIVLDCDLRKPAQHRIFGVKNRGLTNHLVEEMPLAELLQETKITNLRVLTSGPIPPNPSELLGSVRMQETIETLKQESDYIILDTSPVVAVTDACVLASRVNGVVLVLDASQVRPEMAQRAKELLLRAKGQILGVILNKVEISDEHSYYYYYYGSSQKNKKTAI
jgi:capsular exopolysaccharide synthesis family protein